ncbi:MAG: sodium ion-translocating decarboxylase subunit beta, partial [Candidatus Marinimicrobia bacterium]|nr:sodium ion-translocating decarboxylase subunit beta [Candidatus Neomarinimicrobiota bacterium]
MDIVFGFIRYSGFANITIGHVFMIVIGGVCIYLGAAKNYEPLLLIPIGFGIIVGNIPFLEEGGLQIGIYEKGSVLNYLYYGVLNGIYPPLIFLGIGAMTDFSALLSNPKLVMLGAAAQMGIFLTFLVAKFLGFSIQ